MKKLKLIVMGHGEHGKGAVCKLIEKHYGYTSISSSWASAAGVVFPALAGYYDSVEDCYNDRRNWRTLWGQLITRFNHEDKTALARYIFDIKERDIYDGIRQARELHAIREAQLVDFVIWVDASKRKPLESSESMTVDRSMADCAIDNNGPENELEIQVINTMVSLHNHPFTRAIE